MARKTTRNGRVVYVPGNAPDKFFYTLSKAQRYERTCGGWAAKKNPDEKRPKIGDAAKATWKGACGHCFGTIRHGDPIVFEKVEVFGERREGWVHPGCSRKAKKNPLPMALVWRTNAGGWAWFVDIDHLTAQQADALRTHPHFEGAAESSGRYLVQLGEFQSKRDAEAAARAAGAHYVEVDHHADVKRNPAGRDRKKGKAPAKKSLRDRGGDPLVLAAQRRRAGAQADRTKGRSKSERKRGGKADWRRREALPNHGLTQGAQAVLLALNEELVKPGSPGRGVVPALGIGMKSQTTLSSAGWTNAVRELQDLGLVGTLPGLKIFLERAGVTEFPSRRRRDAAAHNPGKKDWTFAGFQADPYGPEPDLRYWYGGRVWSLEILVDDDHYGSGVVLEEDLDVGGYGETDFIPRSAVPRKVWNRLLKQDRKVTKAYDRSRQSELTRRQAGPWAPLGTY